MRVWQDPQGEQLDGSLFGELASVEKGVSCCKSWVGAWGTNSTHRQAGLNLVRWPNIEARTDRDMLKLNCSTYFSLGTRKPRSKKTNSSLPLPRHTRHIRNLDIPSGAA